MTSFLQDYLDDDLYANGSLFSPITNMRAISELDDVTQFFMLERFGFRGEIMSAIGKIKNSYSKEFKFLMYPFTSPSIEVNNNQSHHLMRVIKEIILRMHNYRGIVYLMNNAGHHFHMSSSYDIQFNLDFEDFIPDSSRDRHIEELKFFRMKYAVAVNDMKNILNVYFLTISQIYFLNKVGEISTFFDPYCSTGEVSDDHPIKHPQLQELDDELDEIVRSRREYFWIKNGGDPSKFPSPKPDKI